MLKLYEINFAFKCQYINNRYRDAIVQIARAAACASHGDISGEKNFYQFNLPTIFRE